MTTPTGHPSYRSPTIAEALCEIHFELPSEHKWKPTFPGALFRAIQDEFPEMEPVHEVGVELELSPRGATQKFLPPRQRFKFKHPSKPLVIQLGENVFTVNLLPKYPGWTVMRDHVLRTWEQARGIVSPSKVRRLGLRYINRIKRISHTDRPSNWLKATEYISQGALDSEWGFLSRVEASIDRHNRTIVTLGLQPGDDYGAIVLDIDRILEKDLPTDRETLGTEMDRLHDDVWQSFNSAKSDKLEHLLNGGIS